MTRRDTPVVWNGKWHPLAERFPMLDEEELRRLALSIATSGQHVPCVMGPDGLGYDGRNRVAACAIADVAPTWTIYDRDPVAYIVDVNAERRHLSTGQRAMAVAIGLAEAGKRDGGRFKRGTVPADNAGSLQHWRHLVAQAGVVLDHAPELADLVLAGTLALDAANADATAARRRKDRLAELEPQLLALVDAGVVDLDEAERRAGEQERTARLDDELAERVRAGGLSIDEAEAIAAQRAERIAAWVARLREALELLRPMAPAPFPVELKDALSDDEYADLQAALQAIKRRAERTKQ